MKRFFTVVLLVTLLSILSPIYAQWSPQIIDPFLSYPTITVVTDIDDDGDPDVAVTGLGANQVLWYENNNLTWTKHIIDASLNGALGLDVADIDDDGKLDVVATGYSANKVVWYKNEGGTPIIWTRYNIDNINVPNIVFVEDMDGDNDLDVVATIYGVNDVVWYENEGGTPIIWTKHTIDANLGGAKVLKVADIDNDGDPDLAATGVGVNDVVWYRNNLPDTNWSKITIDSNLSGAWGVGIADIDGDGDLDVAATGQTVLWDSAHVRWYENLNGDGQTWSQHPIRRYMYNARGLYIDDMDLNGTMDVLVTDIIANEVILFWNVDNGQTWTEYYIDSNLDGANGVNAADIDGDSYPDVITTATGVNDVRWYKNPIITGIELPSNITPTSYVLSQNYPNPFNPSTIISWQLPVSNFVTLKVYDVLGNEVASLIDEEKPAGNFEVEFTVSALSSGIYYYKLVAGDFVDVKKMILLK